MTVLKQIEIKKVRKDHYCNACEWLINGEGLNMIRRGEIKTTISERRAIVKAKNNNWKVKKGERALYFVGTYDGEFYYCHSIPEIHDICVKYDLYEDY